MSIKDLTTAEIEERIAGISADMKGPLPNLERRLLHEDRRDLRAELERRAVASDGVVPREAEKA